MGASGILFNEDEILSKSEVFAWYQVSDKRSKENIVEIKNPLDKSPFFPTFSRFIKRIF